MLTTVYILVFILLLAYKSRINNGLFFLIILSYWVILFSIRGETYGLDIITYYKIFLDPSYYSLDEPGLYFFNDVVSYVSNELIWFSFVYSLVLISLLGVLYRLMSSVFWVWVFILFTCTFVFFQINLNIYRQGFAAILGLIGIILAHRKSHIYIVIVLIAFFIHKATLFLVPVYFLMFFRVNSWYIYLTIAFSLLPFDKVLSSLLLGNLVGYIDVMDSALIEYQRVSELGWISSSDYDHRNIPIILTLLLLCFNSELYKNKDSHFVWIIIFSVFISSLFKGNVLIYDRIILYSQIIYPYFIVSYLYKIKMNSHLYLFVISSLLMIFTLYLWGPRNFLGSFVAVEGIF